MAAADVLLLIPPLTQLNTPYPSTAYLTGFLEARGIPCAQADLGIEMVLRLFSRQGLQAVFDRLKPQRADLPPQAVDMLRNESRYLDCIETAVEFLQGRNPKAAVRLARKGFLPQGPRFAHKIGRGVSSDDRAKHRATLFLEDIADLVCVTITPHFALSRYAEHLARSASSFDGLLDALAQPPSLTDEFMLDALRAQLAAVRPALIGLSVPFPGNLYGAFRIAQAVKRERPDIVIVLGGGYANTELRRLRDPRVFDYVDFITLDDGERPLLSLIEHRAGDRPRQALCRTFYREKDRVLFANDPAARNFSMDQVGTPTYRGLPLDRYLTILDSTNPMHRLWSEGHWNKLTVAHGCYWKQCTFCDVGLDYIGRYEMTPTDRLLGQIERLLAETGERGFHFVDEAAPPAALKALALGLLERDLKITWWGNIRFEEAFSRDLCRLLAASGCLAVTAGLEAASDRLLEKMKKGITVNQTALVAAAFREAGILVHAYLMYAFPSETLQETIDALERVRQLFAHDLVQSAFWHRFTATAHSPIGLDPGANDIRILGPKFEGFADNDLVHRDRVGATPEWVGEGLRRSMLNYLEGRGLTMDVRRWFDHPVPRPRVASTWARQAVKTRGAGDELALERRLVWIGSAGRPVSNRRLATPRRRWLDELLHEASPHANRNTPYPHWREVQSSFPGNSDDFAQFLNTPVWKQLRAQGLLLV